MPAEKALGIVLRTTDWSETSRIATLWTREFGRVRVLAKGGRRLRSAFDNALDILTLCDIVLLRKSTGSLDLLTEARVSQRFPRLRDDLAALYGAYYVAELLADWTSDYDPHAVLFDEAVETLRALGLPGGGEVGPRVMRFELTFLRELGYGPALQVCAGCGGPVGEVGLAFSAAAGGVVCGRCQPGQRERRPLSARGLELLRALAAPGDDWRRGWDRGVRAEVRQVLGQYVTYLRGTRPRRLPYLGRAVKRDDKKPTRRRRWPRVLLSSVAGCLLGASIGCQDGHFGPGPADPNMIAGASAGYGGKIKSDWYDPAAYFKPEAPPPPAETLTLRSDGFVAERPPTPGSSEAEMAGARDLYRRGEFEKAEKLFQYHAEKSSDPPMLRAEARFFEAECLRLMGDYPKAADAYTALLNTYQNNPYREPALQHAFDIANFWLEDTREEMKEVEEKKAGKRWMVWPRFISFEQKKPFMDREGRAIEKLEQVRYNDINGPLADKALFLCGSVKFFNEDFKDADFYFSQIYEKHKDSPLAAQAIELAIISKHLSTGGAEYDGRKVVEARKLVQAAFDNYPELAGDPAKRQFLMKQLTGCALQQAEKDYLMAEFWKRTGHPGSAYWYYGLVIQRYPNTKFAELSAQRMGEIKDKVEKENAGKVAPPKLPAPDTSRTTTPTTAPQPLPGASLTGGRQ